MKPTELDVGQLWNWKYLNWRQRVGELWVWKWGSVISESIFDIFGLSGFGNKKIVIFLLKGPPQTKQCWLRLCWENRTMEKIEFQHTAESWN